MIKKGDLSNFQCGMVVGLNISEIPRSAGIFWHFCPSLGCLFDVRGQRRIQNCFKVSGRPQYLK